MSEQAEKKYPEYNFGGYPKGNYAGIMRCIFAEQMMRHDRTGQEGFVVTQKEVAKIRAKIDFAYRQQSPRLVELHEMAEAVMFKLRNGMKLSKLLKLADKSLLKWGAAVKNDAI